jgi:GTP-binding protein
MALAPSKIRNVAVIAHIDHGKTTLLDSLLKQSHVFRENEAIPERVMDSYDQEKERGITIFSKHTSLAFQDYKINIIDTPGHADFSGEVERVLDMVNSVLLLVDAQDGPMPQTRFVLSQALKRGYRPIVVINKIDRPHADPDRVLTDTFDLFVELGANDRQLDFPYCYASGLSGYACKLVDDPRVDMTPLLQMIVDEVPIPSGDVDQHFLMQIATVTYDDFLGRGACGRILRGTVKKGEEVAHLTAQGKVQRMRITRIQGYLGIHQIEMAEAGVGDIVSLSGIPDVLIGDTLCDPEHIEHLPPLRIEEPTLSINILVNSGPLVGREGKHVTMNKLRERLLKEKRSNITLRIEDVPNYQDRMQVSGRGELHLAVLIEAMRREGYEMCLSKPEVITHVTDGEVHEPLERAYVEVPEEYSGSVIQELSLRKGEMHSLNTNEHAITSMEFLIPTRGLMGWRQEFLTMTRGKGIMTTIFEKFVPWKGDIPKRQNGVLIAIVPGKATGYACFDLQNRGGLFVGPGEEVYEGMIVGAHNRDNDLVVNITKEKQLTNVRASGAEENKILTTPRTLTLEQAIDYIAEDEWVEVTPQSIRLRKVFLKENDRKRSARK